MTSMYMRWTCLWRLIRSRGVVVVESTIGRGHGPVLRWETHPNSLEGLPPGIPMPTLLCCRPLAVAHEHSPIVDWRCSRWAQQLQIDLAGMLYSRRLVLGLKASG